jgi:hypothetical protein
VLLCQTRATSVIQGLLLLLLWLLLLLVVVVVVCVVPLQRGVASCQGPHVDAFEDAVTVAGYCKVGDDGYELLFSKELQLWQRGRLSAPAAVGPLLQV